MKKKLIFPKSAVHHQPWWKGCWWLRKLCSHGVWWPCWRSAECARQNHSFQKTSCSFLRNTMFPAITVSPYCSSADHAAILNPVCPKCHARLTVNHMFGSGRLHFVLSACGTWSHEASLLWFFLKSRFTFLTLTYLYTYTYTRIYITVHFHKANSSGKSKSNVWIYIISAVEKH